MRLDEVTKSGAKCKILSLEATEALRVKLLDMGFVAGACLEVVREAPLYDPMELRIHRYLLSLRKSEAHLVQVELI